MGNFYTNITVHDADADAVAATLTAARRRAYVVRAAGMSVVYDERCDMQDLAELEKLARRLSERHGPALAVCNHDDDVLWYALAVNGRTVDRYDSLPSFSGAGGDAPSGGDATALCAAFAKPDATSAVAALLRRPHGEFVLEVDRHAELCRLAGLPEESVALGYRYVARGELGERGGGQPIAVGTTPPPESASAPPASRASNVDEALPPARLAVLTGTLFILLRSEIDVPAEFAQLLGAGRVNAMVAFERLKAYIATHNLAVSAPRPIIRADAVVSAIFGPRDLAADELPELFCRRFAVPPLTEDEEAALARPEPAFMRRFMTMLAEVDRVREGNPPTS